MGKKGNDVLVKRVVIDNQSAVYDDLTFDNVAVIADVWINSYLEIMIKLVVYIINLKMLQRKLFKRRILTVGSIQSDLTASVGIIFLNRQRRDYHDLIPKSLKTQLYKAIRDSFLLNMVLV
jgi:F-type H+-transporting ATPase subunit gamma